MKEGATMQNIQLINDIDFIEDFSKVTTNLTTRDAEDYFEYMCGKARESPDSNLFLQCPSQATKNGISKIFDFSVGTQKNGLTMTYTGYHDDK